MKEALLIIAASERDAKNKNKIKKIKKLRAIVK